MALPLHDGPPIERSIGINAHEPKAIVTYLSLLVALRRWSLRRRFAPEDARDGPTAFTPRGLGVPEDGRR